MRQDGERDAKRETRSHSGGDDPSFSEHRDAPNLETLEDGGTARRTSLKMEKEAKQTKDSHMGEIHEGERKESRLTSDRLNGKDTTRTTDKLLSRRAALSDVGVLPVSFLNGTKKKRGRRKSASLVVDDKREAASRKLKHRPVAASTEGIFRGAEDSAEDDAKEPEALIPPPEPVKEVEVGIVSEIVIKDKSVGLELAVSEKFEDGPALVLEELDMATFADTEAAPGDRVVYIGDQGVRSGCDLDLASELLTTLPRPLVVGIERTATVKSNVKPPRDPGMSLTARADGKRLSIVLPKGKRFADEDLFAMRRPPRPSSQSWDLHMEVSEYPVHKSTRYVWVEDEVCGYALARVKECFRTSVAVTLNDSGESKVVSVHAVKGFHPSHLKQSTDDILSELDRLNLAAVLNRLRVRFLTNQTYYTWMTGNILLAVNPCEEIEGMFYTSGGSPETIGDKSLSSPTENIGAGNGEELDGGKSDGGGKGKGNSKGVEGRERLGAKILFQLADRAFAGAVLGQPQTLVLGGISGSGKSRNAKEIANYLLATKELGVEAAKLRAKLVASNILFQAFGSASTVRCSDATCFNKLTRIHIRNGKVCDLTFYMNMLETDRLVYHNRFERNFHIFYQLCNGWKGIQLSKDLGLKEMNQFYMLGDDNLMYRRYTRPHDTKSAKFPLTSADALKRTLQALELIGMDEFVQEDLLRMLAAILFLGNINFATNSDWSSKTQPSTGQQSLSKTAPKIVVAGEESRYCLEQASSLLEISPEVLEQRLIYKLRPAQSKRSPVPLGARRATVMRNHLICILYSLIVDQVVASLNALFQPKVTVKGEEDTTLNLLEIAGFEFGLKHEELKPQLALSQNTDSANNASNENRAVPCNNPSGPFPRIAYHSYGMSGTTELTPGRFAKSQLLSLQALFQNFTNEVFEQTCYRIIIDTEFERTGGINPDCVQAIQPALGTGSILELFVGNPSGILTVLEQQSLLRGGNSSEKDTKFVKHLNTVHEGNKDFKRATFGYGSFKVKHYGGDFLEYDARGMVMINAQTISFGTQFGDLFAASSSPVLALLGKVARARSSRESYEEVKLNQHIEVQTLSQQRRRSIAQLSESVEGSTMWFVRCVLPRADAKSKSWHGAQVANQLKYLGVRQLCSTRNSQFPVRYSPKDVQTKYASLARRVGLVSETSKLDPRDILQALLGEDSENVLWCSHKSTKMLYLKRNAYRVIQRTRWRLREHSTIIIQHECMKLLERIEHARTIQRFVYRVIIDPAIVRRAALNILNAFRMFHVKSDFAVIKLATVKIQSIVRRFLIQWSDLRIHASVTTIQRVWRGQIIRQRVKLSGVPRYSCVDYFPFKTNVVVRSHLVIQTNSDQALGKASKRRRFLIFTSGTRPLVTLVDAPTRKAIWCVDWVPETRVEATSTGFALYVSTGLSTRQLVFTDVLNGSERVHELETDLKLFPGLHDMYSLHVPVSRVAERFYTALIICGQLSTVSDRSGTLQWSSWRDRFFVFHDRKLSWFKGELMKGFYEVSHKSKVQALNTVGHMDGYFIRILLDTSNEAGCNEPEQDSKLLFRVTSKEERDRWITAIARTINLARAVEWKPNEESAKSRVAPVVQQAMAISRLRSRGDIYFSSNLDQTSLLRESSSSVVVSKRSTTDATGNSGSGSGNGSGGGSGSGGNASDQATPGRTEEVILKDKKDQILRARPSQGLYHLVTTKEYIQEHAPRNELEQVADPERYRRVSMVKASVGRHDEAMESFINHAPLQSAILKNLHAERSLEEDFSFNRLLLYSEPEPPRKRRSRRKHKAELTHTNVDDGVDLSALANDEDGNLLSELLENLSLSQYWSRFKREGIVSIRQSKNLSHGDLLDSFGVESFSHRERLLDAFQNYGKIGSSLTQPKRNSLRLEQVFFFPSEMRETLELYGLEKYHTALEDNKCSTLEDVRRISTKQLKRMGFTDEERNQLKAALAASPGPDPTGHNSSKLADAGSSRGRESRGHSVESTLSDTGSQHSATSSLSGGEALETRSKGGSSGDLDEITEKVSKIRFADQMDWSCRVCHGKNPTDAHKCERCGWVPAHASERLEKVCLVETCVAWRCQTCRVVNTYDTYLCDLCGSRRPTETTYSSEQELKLGDRVKVIAYGIYPVPKNMAGTVVEVSLAKSQCLVQFDDGRSARIAIDDVRKLGRMNPLARLNGVFNRMSIPTKLSTPARLAAAFQGHR